MKPAISSFSIYKGSAYLDGNISVDGTDNGLEICLWWGAMSVGRLVIINLIKLSSMDVIHDKMVV